MHFYKSVSSLNLIYRCLIWCAIFWTLFYGNHLIIAINDVNRLTPIFEGRKATNKINQPIFESTLIFNALEIKPTHPGIMGGQVLILFSCFLTVWSSWPTFKHHFNSHCRQIGMQNLLLPSNILHNYWI